MRCAVRPNAYTAMRTGNHHVEISVADGNTYLVEVARRGKGGVCAKDRQLALAGQADGNRCGRLLCNAHAQPALLSLRVPGIKLIDGDGAADVQPQAADAGIVACGAQSFTEACACGAHFNLHRWSFVPPI